VLGGGRRPAGRSVARPPYPTPDGRIPGGNGS